MKAFEVLLAEVMSGQNKQMVSSRIKPQESQGQAYLHQSEHTVQIRRKHALIKYDTPTGRTCNAMHIPVLGLIDKSTSVINTGSIVFYNAGMFGSSFDVCRKMSNVEKNSRIFNF